MADPATLYCNACGAAMSASDAVCPACRRPPRAGISAGAVPAATQPVVRTDDRVRRHIGTLSIFYFILAVLNGLAAVVLFIVSTFVARQIQMEGTGPDVAPMVLRIIGSGLLVVAAVFFSIGWGLHERRAWGRIAALIAAFILLFHIPFGTALGIYTLWVLISPESDHEYQRLAAEC